VAESALIVRVPEAEPLVGPFREKFDPTAVLGVPAHITVLHPFIPPDRIGRADLERLGRIANATTAFTFRLVAAKQFSDALYLDPEPAEPFIALTESVVRAFPEYPPYEGQFASIIPHLTVARGSEMELRALQEELGADTRLRAGVDASCSGLVLIENSSGRWQERHAFLFSDGAHNAG
jgi:2'-5' RNA ligase